MAEQLRDAGRELVPTERELALGTKAAEYVRRVHEEPTLQREPFRKALGRYLRDLDPRTIEGPKLALVIFGIFLLVAAWDDTAIGVLLPEMRTSFGFSLQFLLTISSVVIFVSRVIGPVMGYVADRVQRVWLVRLAALLQAGGALLTGLATGVPMLVGGRLLGGIGPGVGEPALFPLATDYFPMRSRARVVSFVLVTAGIGGVIGPTVAGRLSDAFGWRFAIASLSVLSFIVFALTFLLREPKRGYLDRVEAGASEDDAAREQRALSWGEGWRAARSIVTLRRFWYATPFQFAVFIAIIGLLPVYFAQEFGLSASARGYVISASSAAGLLSLIAFGPLADRFMFIRPQLVPTLLGASIVVSALAVAAIAFVNSLWLAIAIVLPLGIFRVLLAPAYITFVSLVVPARVRGLGIQTLAPWQLAGFILANVTIFPAANTWGIRTALALLIPMLLIQAVITISAGSGVDRDIRAAIAASMAEQEAERARKAGRAKMLICRDVDVAYDGVQVLFGLDFDVEDGEIVALLGTNGAGKSTLLRAIGGVQEASGGAIFLDGADITHVPPHEIAQRGVVMVPGGHAIFPTLTVDENLRTAGWMYREDEDWVRARTEEVLDMFPVLRERLQQQAGNLSGGEQQMIALGQAFLMRPRLLMIDELSLGLAPSIVEQLLQTLRRIHEQGTTIVLVEQSINVALTVARRAVFMEKGEIRFDGLTTELLRQPDLVRSVFMGGAVSGSISARGPARLRSEDRERLLHVQDVSVSFGGVQALTDASVDAQAGEIVGIIGPNGAGKTTLFDVISGFMAPDDGRVFIEATDATDLGPDERARLGLGRSFQNVRLFPAMTVRENIAVAFERHVGSRNPILAAAWTPQVLRSERRIARRVEALIELLGLRAYADKFVNELSTGTRRTVDIACIMASEPRVLLLDEPSSGLAQAETEEMGPVLTRLARESGAALVVIEHDIPLITSISDRLVAMELGSVVTSGDPHEVMADPRVVASFLSASEASLARSDSASLAEVVGRAVGVQVKPRPKTTV